MGDTEKGYQGWTNYETWAVNLWLGNEQGSHEYWQEQARAPRGERAGSGADVRVAAHKRPRPHPARLSCSSMSWPTTRI